MTYYKKSFTPKKPVRTFRDLEVYQKMNECAVLISKNIMPKLAQQKYPFAERLNECAISIPLLIAEAHSLRFADFALGVGFLEKAMSATNKTIAYLEHARGLYGSKIDQDLVEDIIGRYANCRIKMFRLEQAWKRYRSEYEDDGKGKGKGGFAY